MINIIVAGNLILLRDMLCDTLNQEEDFNVIATASEAKEILRLCDIKKPNLILMDISADNNSNLIMHSGIIKKKHPEIKIIIMINVPDITLIYQCHKLNIDSLVCKDISRDSLSKIIRTTMQGYSTYPNTQNNETAQNNILKMLSDKELEILTSYSKTLDREQVAKSADISQRTLNSHIASIYEKTGFDNLNKLVIYCISNGYLTPPSDNSAINKIILLYTVI